jgi:cellulose synthase/poly-beta-1,6-N-acetylglucosamine synthase-like glycosyltransferase
MSLILTFSFLILLAFSFIVIFLLFNILFKKQKLYQPQGLHATPLSIIIPFRNEEKNLPILLHSLDKQQFTNFELLLINDSSEDNSIEIVTSLMTKVNIPVRLLESHFDHSINLTSKQQAIDFGIKNARYDYIILTDADMQFSPDWLLQLSAPLQAKPDMVIGHTEIADGKKTIFAFTQSFQLEFLFSIAWAFDISGITGSCMGNNLLISKKTYMDLGGQQRIGYSITEDRDLYNLFIKNGKKCIFSTPFTAKAFTNACSSLKQFYFQMRRWVQGGFKKTSNLLPIGFLFATQNLIFVLSGFAVIPMHLKVIAIINFILTWYLVFVCFRKIDSSVSALYYPLFYLFLIFESILLLFSFLIQPSLMWKGRKV